MRYLKKLYPLKVLSVLTCCIIITTISSCSKDDLLYQNTPYDKVDFTVFDAQKYFESSSVLAGRTKSESNFRQGFYTGEFIPDWENAKFSTNGILSGYDVDLISPQYEFIAEETILKNGNEITFDVEISQKLVILKHNKNGRMAQYIMTLIPEKEYYEKYKNGVKRKFISNSASNDFSGVVVHALPQIGVPVCITKYKNGNIVSSVYMVARSQEQILENSQKALELIGTIRVKVKENIYTKGGSTWNLDKFEYLGGGYYYDGTDVWLDFDGDGIPDYRVKDTVYVDGETGGGSGGGTGNGTTPDPDDDWGGDGMGNPNEGNDGGGSSNNDGESSGNSSSNGINDHIVYTGTNCERIVSPLIQTLSKSNMARSLMETLGNIAFLTGNFDNPGAYDPNNGITKLLMD